MHPSVLGADWGAQRVNGLSIKALLKNMLVRKKRTPGDIRQKDTEKSLIENFLYPKFGPGQLWETAAQEIERDEKGTILLMHRLVGIHYEDGLIRSITAATPDGHVDIPCDYVLSSMPVKRPCIHFHGNHRTSRSLFRSDLFALPGFHHSRHPRGPPQNPTQRTAAHLRKPHTGHLDLHPRAGRVYRTAPSLQQLVTLFGRGLPELHLVRIGILFATRTTNFGTKPTGISFPWPSANSYISVFWKTKRT